MLLVPADGGCGHIADRRVVHAGPAALRDVSGPPIPIGGPLWNFAQQRWSVEDRDLGDGARRTLPVSRWRRPAVFRGISLAPPRTRPVPCAHCRDRFGASPTANAS